MLRSSDRNSSLNVLPAGHKPKGASFYLNNTRRTRGSLTHWDALLTHRPNSSDPLILHDHCSAPTTTITGDEHGEEEGGGEEEGDEENGNEEDGGEEERNRENGDEEDGNGDVAVALFYPDSLSLPPQRPESQAPHRTQSSRVSGATAAVVGALPDTQVNSSPLSPPSQRTSQPPPQLGRKASPEINHSN
ncbi:MAG: hypothetical protein M1831_007187 [Alyxoria varia]|nr:MAG: hypothetical protein M1831_007187 [Alyxoria varia]